MENEVVMEKSWKMTGPGKVMENDRSWKKIMENDRSWKKSWKLIGYGIQKMIGHGNYRLI